MAGAGSLVVCLPLAWVASGAERTNAVLLELEGKVEISRADSPAWDPARTNQALYPKDRVQTLERSRAVVQLSDLSEVRLGELSFLQIPDERTKSGAFRLLRGLLYYFHRDKPGTFPVQTPSAYAVVLGTEFTVEVRADGSTRLELIHGEVTMTNALGSIRLESGEAGLAEAGRMPVKTVALEANQAIQWVLYYPGVLDLDELKLAPLERELLAPSLQAYRSGDLRQALQSYPSGRQPAADAERVYLAALELSVGRIPAAEALLGSLTTDRLAHLAEALRTLIAAVQLRPRGAMETEDVLGASSATRLLAESYSRQARHDLAGARAAAERAVEVAAGFGFAWARLAELEFGFGHRAEAGRALRQARALAPRLAAAVALQGFVLASENRVEQARRAFDEAIGLDGALGEAWLGRGLCRIRLGDAEGGREDLLVAATVEPQRALFRSYLGKAFSQRGDLALAQRELDLARGMDSGDPTAWLYSALLHRQENEINDAVRELEHARTLNHNRGVYRSRLLLDQDRAVQGVNLAGVYADAGMQEVSARAAGQAVQIDPANFAAHLFLGHSYQRLRDLSRFNQRFETAAVSEYLLANLLAPVGAGTLAQSVTQNEYAKLFEADGLGFSSATEYASRGAWVQSAAQYGTWRDFSYALSGFYNSDPGQRANHDVLQHEVSLQLQQQINSSDSLYFQAIRSEIETGDRAALPDPAQANRTLRAHEEQTPLLLGGYHREWAPGVHSLLLVGWLTDDQRVRNDQQQTYVLNAQLAQTFPVVFRERYQAEERVFTAELQELWQQADNNVVLGARYQTGELDTRARETNLPLFFPIDPEHLAGDVERASGYGYYQWRPISPLLLVAGLSYDRLRFPVNFRYAPVTRGEAEVDQLSPKGGILWTPSDRTTWRAGYAQSLGGAGIDQSFRLEPTQVAGFNQAFRSIMPESLTGANSAALFETTGLAVERRLGRGTYLGVSGEWLRSEVDRVIGSYDYLLPLPAPPVVKSSTRQHLDYDEHNLLLTCNQLVGREWSFGMSYRLSHAELRSDFRNLPATAGFQPRTDTEAVLHQVGWSAVYQHSSGFFGQAETWWHGQVNHGAAANVGRDDFWQFNLWAGWRGWHRRVEIRVGILNLTGQDYRLNPLNLSSELPRERSFVAGLRFNL